MKFLFDTDHISALQRRSNSRHAALCARLLLVGPKDVAFSVISFHEQVLGAHAFLNRASNSAALVRGYELFEIILGSFAQAQVLRFDSIAAQKYEELVAMRLRVGSMDLKIAAIALTSGFTVITSNTRDFGRVPSLATEDWTT